MAVGEEISEADVVAYLCALDANTVPHTGRSLLAHLKGTAALIADWGLPREVILAALCHSVYGTERFQHVTLNPNDRAVLRRQIGRAAERLVFLFHRLRRTSLFSGQGPSGLRWINDDDLEAAPREFEYLACIGIANFIETLLEKDFFARCHLMGTRHHWENVKPYLTAQANTRIGCIYAENHVPPPLVAGVAFLRRVRHSRTPVTMLEREII